VPNIKPDNPLVSAAAPCARDGQATGPRQLAHSPVPALPSSESALATGGRFASLQSAVAPPPPAAGTLKGVRLAGDKVPGTAVVKTGLDVLRDKNFALLSGRAVAVITNQTGCDARDQSIVSLLQQAQEDRLVRRLVCLFGPEHGLDGTLDGPVSSSVDGKSGLKVYSLFGDHYWPTRDMLKGVDTLVFDIQDPGTRFASFVSTLYYAMREAKTNDLRLVVLDRPNPINAAKVAGPVLKDNVGTFPGVFELPVQHGMTVAELAGLFNDYIHLKPERLVVVPMEGYARELWFDQTGIRWIDPLPGIRSITAEMLYPGVGMLEAANLSVGRGTSTPFECVGAPWIADASQLAVQLSARQIPGVVLVPAEFVPTAGTFTGQKCRGVRLLVVARDQLDAPMLGIELACWLQRINPIELRLARTGLRLGSEVLIDRMVAGEEPGAIRQDWQRDLNAFRQARRSHLLYA